MRHDCPLCQQCDAATLITTTSQLRVVWANEPGYPCFIRVIWNAHVSEMTDLSPDQRTHLMDTVFTVETVLRQILAAEGVVKINLASLGNWVPHLHWHVIPRFTNDAHWPNSTFSTPSRADIAGDESRGESFRPAIAKAICAALA